MPSSRTQRLAGRRASRVVARGALALASAVAATAFSAPAAAQQQAQGFAVERFYPSAPGGGWMVMDDLAMHGGLGGVIALSGGYARNALRLSTSDGSQRADVVSDQAFADIAVAVTYERFRLYIDVTSPLVVGGTGGAVGAYQFTAPSFGVPRNPDSLADTRIGADVRLLGDATGAFRAGVGAQLFVPAGERADYVTDGTYRGMVRALFAGNMGALAYAGHVGIHLRPLDDAPTPGSPRGDEVLFGIAGGPKLALGRGTDTVVVVGPELFGERATRSFFGTTATGVEGLLTGRLECPRGDGTELRLKLGAGGGIHPRFGAPEARIVFAIEVAGHAR